MGAWPTDDLTKVHLDAGTDSPKQARLELEALLDKVKAILAAYGDVSGVATLDAGTEVPAAQLGKALLKTNNLSDVTAATGRTNLGATTTGDALFTTASASVARTTIGAEQAGTTVQKSGDAMTGLLTLSGDPTGTLHAATKQYVDASIPGPASITQTELAKPSVGTPELIDSSVTTAKIANSNVTQGKMASSSVGRGQLKTTTVSLSGTIYGGTGLGITMSAYAFFPMIHTQNSFGHHGHTFAYVIGHSTDGASADSPRFRLYPKGNSLSYDVDYRYIQS